MIDSTCEICGDVSPRIIVQQDEWQVLRCPKCELGWLYPRPDLSHVTGQYDEAYFVDHRIMTADTDEQLASKVKGQSSRVRFVKRLKRGGALLDIGCASGHFLGCAAEAGFEVEGIEVSEYAVRQGRERLGLSIEQGTIETVSFPSARFDVITMWHVFEHFADPVGSLQNAARWLKPDGVLVVECPNSGSFDARKYGTEWAGWRIPYHLWHFTPKSLGKVFERAGFEVRCIQTSPSLWLRNVMRRIPLLSLARNLICPLFTGRDMRLVARQNVGT